MSLMTAHDSAEAARAVVAYLDDTPPGPAGVLRVEVTGAGPQAWTVVLTSDGARLDPDARPDAVLRLAYDDLVALVEGRADAALLYLGERLEVSGDESFVLALGTVLRAPGAERAVIDPAALDPLAVSAAISGVSTEHLSAVMAGAFRGPVLSEVFSRLPQFLNAERAVGATVTVAFEIEREGPGVDRYVVHVDSGACAVTESPTEVPVDATLVLAGHEFLRLVLGHLNPVRGVLSGQIRVRGHVVKALGFNAVIDIPGR